MFEAGCEDPRGWLLVVVLPGPNYAKDFQTPSLQRPDAYASTVSESRLWLRNLYDIVQHELSATRGGIVLFDVVESCSIAVSTVSTFRTGLNHYPRHKAQGFVFPVYAIFHNGREKHRSPFVHFIRLKASFHQL